MLAYELLSAAHKLTFNIHQSPFSRASGRPFVVVLCCCCVLLCLALWPSSPLAL